MPTSRASSYLARVVVFVAMLFVACLPAIAKSGFQEEWSKTDFSQSLVDLSEIISGGPPKDGIPAIDDPKFKPVSAIEDIGTSEPVIVLVAEGKAKAYPLRVLMWHEIVNDTFAERPVTVTYCPLCNAAVVFDRRVNGMTLDFGVSGKLRHSDMIMYDRQTGSWWQQFTGRAIVGDMAGAQLGKLPSRIMPFGAFRKAYPNGKVLVPNNKLVRRYGANPYAKYDTKEWPFLFRGEYDGPVPPLAYVVSVGANAWPLADLRDRKRIEHDNIVIEWSSGMNSALDQHRIGDGRDIGFVVVRREHPDGTFEDIVHDMTFAFVFKTFHPDGTIHKE